MEILAINLIGGIVSGIIGSFLETKFGFFGKLISKMDKEKTVEPNKIRIGF